MAFQRAIELAYDKENGNLYDANEIFKVAKNAYELRRQSNEGTLKLYCFYCHQLLDISDSKNDHVHFKHLRKSDDCVLKNGKMSEDEVAEYNGILRAKESPRHKHLKTAIAQLLSKVPGVDRDSIIADTKFFFSEIEKRRPDVYCVYEGKQIAFEIQLSNLSQRYLLARSKFYRSKGIYLIWILDEFSVYGQSKMERDIKYLTPSQNFFKLDEQATEFKLLCDYKQPYITLDNRIEAPWKRQSLSLSQLQFDDSAYLVYFLNYHNKVNEMELQLKERKDREVKEHIAKQEAMWRERTEERVAVVMRKLKSMKDRKWSFYRFHEELDSLSSTELELLNQKLGFNSTRVQGKTLLNQYIAIATKEQESLIRFLLTDVRIEIDVNAIDDDGTTSLQRILTNRNLDYRRPLLQSLFKRGYCLKPGDLEVHQKLEMGGLVKLEEQLLLKWSNQLNDRSLIDHLFKNTRYFYLIECARQKEMFLFNYPSWINFAVNAMIKFKQQWLYTERAFKHYGLWEIILANDKHKSFRKQLDKIIAEQPEQDLSWAYPLMREIYREIA